MIWVLTVSCYMIMVCYFIVDVVIYCNYFDFFFSDELLCVKFYLNSELILVLILIINTKKLAGNLLML